jgi:hypothetical protein
MHALSTRGRRTCRDNVFLTSITCVVSDKYNAMNENSTFALAAHVGPFRLVQRDLMLHAEILWKFSFLFIHKKLEWSLFFEKKNRRG